MVFVVVTLFVDMSATAAVIVVRMPVVPLPLQLLLAGGGSRGGQKGSGGPSPRVPAAAPPTPSALGARALEPSF